VEARDVDEAGEATPEKDGARIFTSTTNYAHSHYSAFAVL